MQRLFTMFPTGFPGVALVLLRVAVAIGTVLAVLHAAHWWVGPVGLIVLALCLGALTHIFAALSLALQGVGCAVVGGDPVMRLLVSLVTVALLLLGPGAYSLDARRFGRKLMTFPEEEDRLEDS